LLFQINSLCFPIDSQDVNYGNTLGIQEPVSKVYKIYDYVNYDFMADNNSALKIKHFIRTLYHTLCIGHYIIIITL
jgi:hypothetical protein